MKRGLTALFILSLFAISGVVSNLQVVKLVIHIVLDHDHHHVSLEETHVHKNACAHKTDKEANQEEHQSNHCHDGELCFYSQLMFARLQESSTVSRPSIEITSDNLSDPSNQMTNHYYHSIFRPPIYS